ncbi:hypothetical protein, partial [Pseudomonas hunanensis]|uniref:hypothetical protein n=1 Tax=Pseudomonas hunanensis TaxID=1247546 RepID=UPI0030DBBD2A
DHLTDLFLYRHMLKQGRDSRFVIELCRHRPHGFGPEGGVHDGGRHLRSGGQRTCTGDNGKCSSNRKLRDHAHSSRKPVIT